MTDKLTILGQTVKWKTMDGTFVDVSAQVAFDTLRHVRLVLPSQSFDADDLASQRARVVRTARLAPSFDEARQALELLEITPKSLRMRKRELSHEQRAKNTARMKA